MGCRMPGANLRAWIHGGFIFTWRGGLSGRHIMYHWRSLLRGVSWGRLRFLMVAYGDLRPYGSRGDN